MVGPSNCLLSIAQKCWLEENTRRDAEGENDITLKIVAKVCFVIISCRTPSTYAVERSYM